MAVQSFQQGPVAPGASSQFTLGGGLYGINAHSASWGGGSCAIQMLGPDGVTFITVGTPFAADGFFTGYLPAGIYQFLVVTTTAVYVPCTLIPQR